MRKYIGVIFARGGSKGVPKKNLRIFNGRPLIAWSIDQALSCEFISEVYVSTDSEEIAQVARSFGAKVPFLRPMRLAMDDSPEWGAWQHFISFLRDQGLENIDGVISLPTVAPLRKRQDVLNCIKLFEERVADLVLTVTQSKRNPFFNMVTVGECGKVDLVCPGVEVYRRQDVPVVYDVSTAVYVMRPAYVLQSPKLLGGLVFGCVINSRSGVDIDSPDDFDYAEFLHRQDPTF